MKFEVTLSPSLKGLEDVELLPRVELQVPKGDLLGHSLSHLLAESRRDAMLAHELDGPQPGAVGAVLSRKRWVRSAALDNTLPQEVAEGLHTHAGVGVQRGRVCATARGPSGAPR